MADTNNLNGYLTDIADAIRAKKGTSSPINANSFDIEIASIPTGTQLPNGIYIQNSMPTKNTAEAFWLYEHSGDKASDLIPPETMIGNSISFGQVKSALIDQNLLNEFDAAYYHVFAVSSGGGYASVAFSNNAYRVYSSYSANYTYVGNGIDYVWACNFSYTNADPNHLIFTNQSQVGYYQNAYYQSWGIDFCDQNILYTNGALWRAANVISNDQDGLCINVGNEQYVVYQSEAVANTFDKILNSQGLNATSNDIIFGKTAIVNNQKLTGTIQQNSINITPSMVTQIINNAYYTNSQINSISVSNEYINWINTSENILGTTVSRYNALEYLQGNNTQRINTGYIPSANTSIEINIYKPSDYYISWERVFSAGQGNFEVMRDNTSNQFIFHGSHGIIAGRFNIANNTFYTLKINNGALYLNNVQQFTFNQNSIMGDALNLFHGGDRNSGFRVYSCKIYDNDTLQMDLHPAEDANNIACMYDRISGNYLYETNMKNFIAGPETNTLLNDVLDTMQSEKTTKIVPQNIANGITIFGITGNLVGGGASVLPEGTRMSFAESTFTDAPDIDTSNVVLAIRMFDNCKMLKNVPNYNLSNVTDMENTFQLCENLITVPNFNLVNVKKMYCTFALCYNLVDLPEFDIPNVDNLGLLAYHCNNLSNDSVINIVKMCIKSNVNSVPYKNLMPTSPYSPLSNTKFDNSYYIDYHEALTAAGWTY